MLSKNKRPAQVVLLVGLLLALSVSTAAAALASFQGNWRSTDIDGSQQSLAISRSFGGGHHFLVYFDRGASICGWTPGAPGPAAIAAGVGAESGLELSANMPTFCLGRPLSYLGSFPFVFTYDPSSDTMEDGGGVHWFRN